MEREQAIQLVGFLVGATTGWNDEAVEVYVHEFEGLDYVAAVPAIQYIARTWTEARRPPIGAILSAYHGEQKRLESMRDALPRAVEPTIGPREGRKVMEAAYRAERIRRGRDPDVPMDSWLLCFTSASRAMGRTIHPGTRRGLDDG